MSAKIITIGFALIIFLMSCVAVTWSLITVAPLLLLLSVIGLVVVLSHKECKSSSIHWEIGLVVLCFLYFGVRAFYSPVTEYGRQDLFLVLISSIIFIGNVLIGKKVSLQIFYIICVCLILFINVLMLHSGINSLRDNLFDYARGTNVTGMYGHRNIYGNMIMMCTLVCISLVLFCNKGAVLKWLRLMKKERSVGAILMGFVTLAVPLMGYTGYKLIDHLRFQDHIGVLRRDGGRPDMYAMAIDQVPDAPLLGSGSRSFYYKSYENFEEGSIGGHEDLVFVHNEFLQSLTDYGIIGFVLLLLLLFFTLFKIVNYLVMFKEVDDRNWINLDALRISSMAVIVGMLVHSMVSFPFHSYSSCALFAVIFSWWFIYGDEKLTCKKRINWLSNVVIRLSLLLFVCAGIYVAGNETRASLIFLKQGIKDDVENWDPSSVNSTQWRSALEQVIEIAPNHNRYGKLASLNLLQARNNEVGEREELLSEAYQNYSKSLDYHPYYSVAMLNQIDYLLDQENFNEAEVIVTRVKQLNRNREKFFNILYREGKLYYLETLEDLSKEDFTSALVHCTESIEVLLKGLDIVGVRQDVPHKYLYSKALLLRVYLLRKLNHRDEAVEEFDKYFEFSRKYLNTSKEDKIGFIEAILFEADRSFPVDLARELSLRRHLSAELTRYSALISSSELIKISDLLKNTKLRIAELERAGIK